MIATLHAIDKKRLTEIAKEILSLLAVLHPMTLGGNNVATAMPIIKKILPLLKQMEGLTEACEALHEITLDGPLMSRIPELWPQHSVQYHADAIQWLNATIAAATPGQRKRRRRPPAKIVPLTPAQLEAYELVAKHQGNYTEAAKEAGKSRTMIERQYQKALAKLGKAGVSKRKLQNLPHDRRGQVDVADENAPDMNAVDPSKRRK